jgi:predicted methyltransferase
MGTPAMLAAAIEIASQIPDSNPTHAEANQMIDQWSYQILQLAEAQAGMNVAQAIAIAEQVPANTAAYASAQRSIQTWRQTAQP